MTQKTNLSTEELLTKRGAFIRDMFASIAGIYDLMNSVFSLMFDRHWRDTAAKAARLPEDARVLDVCCGTGKLALEFLRILGPKAPVVGADFCREMILAGARHMRPRERALLRFIEADTLLLPFADNTFDAVSAAFGIRNVADIERGVGEMARVVRPGGKVLILDFARPRNAVFRRVYEFYFTRVVPLAGRMVHRGGTSPYEYLPRSVLRFVTADELARIMTQRGLVDIQTRELTMGVAALVIGTKAPSLTEKK
jgi:demethylmenaquinone methyltransferase/2-methoxy-6-polyprenyl-1,4-benzoquinol methylase